MRGGMPARISSGFKDTLFFSSQDPFFTDTFKLESYPEQRGEELRRTIILACLSKKFFRDAIEKGGSRPLLWTTGLMAPEAYTLASALEGWVLGESNSSIRLRAAASYSKYQNCSLEAAMRLLVN